MLAFGDGAMVALLDLTSGKKRGETEIFDAAMSDCSSSDCCREDATFLNASSMNGSPDAGRELGAARIAASAGYRNIRRETLWLRMPDLPPEGGSYRSSEKWRSSA